jgi:REP element-mobilizing transposase RayT
MCTASRANAFMDSVLVARVQWQILRTSGELEFAVLAYTFMPDHVHLLIEAKAEVCDFRRLMALLRRRTTIACKDLTGRVLWQDGFHERVLRDGEDPTTTIDYILNNPVRAGMVAKATDHPFSWSITLDKT